MKIIYLGDMSFHEPICSLYLIKGEKLVMIDAGPSTTFQQALKALRDEGVKELDYIIVTHPHLDHSGSTSLLLKEMSNTKVIIYHTGLKHFLHPEALLASAKEALGEAFSYMGGIEPIKEDLIIPVKDEEELNFGDFTLRFLFAPGHAPHHMAIFEESTRTLFPADSYCVYLPETKGLIPQAPPPHFDLARVLTTLRKLKDLKPKTLCLPHFGMIYQNTLEFTDKNLERFEEWKEVILGLLKEGKDFENIRREILIKYDEELKIIKESKLRYLLFNMHIRGFIKYLTDTYL